MSLPNIWKGTTQNWATGANWTAGTPNVEAGAAQAGAGSTITLRSGASVTNSIYNGQVVFITGGTGAGQQRIISGYVGSTKVATVSVAWSVNPDATSVYQVGDAGVFSASSSVMDIDATVGSLDQHATLLTSLTIDNSYSGAHGSATAPLQIGAATVTIGGVTGFGQGAGSGRLYHNYGNSVFVATINILSTSQSSNEPSLPPYRFIGGGSANYMVVNSQSGFWGIAALPGEVAFATINIVSASSANQQPTQAYIGAGATINALEMQNGQVINQSAQTLPSVNVEGGQYVYLGTGSHTNLTVGTGASCTYAGGGNLTGTIKVSGVLDMSGDARAKQITNGILAYKGANINLDNGQANITADGMNPITLYLQQCDLSDIKLVTGQNAVNIVRS
jgi:hypothetical protein